MSSGVTSEQSVIIVVYVSSLEPLCAPFHKTHADRLRMFEYDGVRQGKRKKLGEWATSKPKTEQQGWGKKKDGMSTL